MELSSVHVIRRILAKHVLCGNQDVVGQSLRRHLLAPKHPHGDGQNLIAIAVKEIGHRTQNDTAAVFRIYLLLLAGAAMDPAAGALTHDDAIAVAPGGFNCRFGSEGGGIVERRDKQFAPGLSAEKLGEDALGPHWLV